MASYRYKAMTLSGAVVQGSLEAPNEAAVIQHIREKGHYPLSASPARAGGLANLVARLTSDTRPSFRGLSLATQEFATLLRAGLDIDRALGILLGLSGLGPLREPLTAVRARVRDGASLADALNEEKAFPKFYVSMVRAGEMGGTLDVTMARLSDYLVKTLSVREAVVSALVYPLILLASAGLSIIFIVTFVLPEFEPLFAQAGKSLPLPARIIMHAGHFVQDFWWLLVIAVAGCAYWLRAALKRPAFRRQVDARLLKLPLLGELLAAIDVERFSRTLGILLTNGVAVPTALGLAKDVCRNSVLSAAAGETALSLREGDGIAQRLAQTNVFPKMTIDLIRVGEETGKLDEMLLRQADLDEQRIRHTLDRLLAFLVPGLTIFLGLIVGGLVASMMTAILSLNDLALQ
jgi:general secretion pathway protein F